MSNPQNMHPAVTVLVIVGILGALTWAVDAEQSKPPQIARPATQAFICKAAMGFTFGYPAFHMKASQSGSKARITWRAKSDSKTWATNCWLTSRNTVMWQSIRADGTLGRVRDHKLDSKLTWQPAGSKLYIKETHSDGSSGGKHYAIPKAERLTP